MTPQAQTQAEPRLHRVASVMSGRRYLLLTFASTAVAVAHAARHVEDRVTAKTLLHQLMASRTSSMIAMHFYAVMTYHVFLAVAYVCFKTIRPAELQQTKETLIHFVLMRCLLLASTMGPAQEQTSMGVLLLWLSSIAFLRGLLSFCRARFEHLVTRPMPQWTDLRRLGFVLSVVIALDVVMALLWSSGHSFAQLVTHFAWFEGALLMIKALQLGVKVLFHVFDVGNTVVLGSEKGEFYLLVLQTALSGCYLVQLVFYYLYIISMDQFRISFLDFILILNVKNATVQVLEKLRHVKLYHDVVLELDECFLDATQQELDAVADDVCVICLKPMTTHAKKLQCGHLFHRFCLRQCLQKASIGDAFTALDPVHRAEATLDAAGAARTNTTLRCPICRKRVDSGKQRDPSFIPITEEQNGLEPEATPADAPHNDETPVAPHVAAPVAPPQPQVPSETEDVFRFSTEFLSRWIPFPTLSFEIVRHRDNPAPFVVTPDMIQQIYDVFPQYSVEELQADLVHTRSPERTVERILSGHFDMDRIRERQEQRSEIVGAGVPVEAINEIEEEMTWNVSALLDNVWSNPPAPEPSVASENTQTSQPESDAGVEQSQAERTAVGSETLLRRLQRWRSGSDGRE